MSYLGTVLIIDSSAPSAWFSVYMVNKGYECINIWSSVDVYEKLFRITYSETISESFFYTNDTDLQTRLSGKKIVFVTNGSDFGLALADQISALYGLNQNGKTSERFDRFLTSLEINEPAAVDNIPEFLEVHKKIVIKPRCSAGGYDSVKIVCTGEPIPAIDGCFAQPYYDNKDEYGIDVVSKDGFHQITSVWKYTKYPDSIANVRYELLSWDKDREILEKIRDFVIASLDKLEYRLGACHVEVIHVDDKIRLVEFNFRCHGHLDDRSMVKALNGKSQTNLLAEAVFGDSKFSNEYEYAATMAVTRILLTPDTPVRASTLDWKKVESMPSIGRIYKMHSWYETIPARQHMWRHLLANIILVGASTEELIADEAHIREYLKCL